MFYASATEFKGDESAPSNEWTTSVDGAPNLALSNAVLNVGGGEDANLWLIGSVDKNPWTQEYGVGAHWLKDGNEANAYKNIATLNVTGDYLNINSGDQNMWLGNVISDGDVVLLGQQIWLPSVKANSFFAVGGTDAEKLWNAGVWVYGEIENPLTWPAGSKYTGEKAIDVVETARLDGVYVWVSGATDVGGHLSIGSDKTDSIWMTDVKADDDVDLLATGDKGSIWVNSITVASQLFAEATWDIAVWLDNNIENVTNANGVTIGGTTPTSLGDSAFDLVSSERGLVRSNLGGSLQSYTWGGLANTGGSYYW